MIALVVFSMLIGMSGQFISAGVNRPFVADRIEPWLQLMEKSRISLQKLSQDSPLRSSGVHQDPFPELAKPRDMSGWKLEWRSTSLEDYQAACFSAKTRLNKSVEWHVFQKK